MNFVLYHKGDESVVYFSLEKITSEIVPAEVNVSGEGPFNPILSILKKGKDEYGIPTYVTKKVDFESAQVRYPFSVNSRIQIREVLGV